MIQIEEFEDVIHLRMSRELDGRPLYWTSAFYVDGLLIDTGPSYTASELVSFLKDHPPKIIVNTHYHEDHIGGNRLIQDTFDCPIYAPKEAIDLIAGRPKLYPYQELVWGYPEPSFPLPVPDKIHTPRYTFSILSTPGHSRDHVSLVEENQGWYFTGDLIPGEKIKTLRPEEDIGEIVSSIQLLRELNTSRMVVFSGTGRIFTEGRKTIDGFLSFVSDLRRKVIERHLSGSKTGEIVEAIFGNEDPKKALTQDQFSCENLVKSIIDTF